MADGLVLYVNDGDGAAVIDTAFLRNSDERYDTLYPGGLFGNGSFFLPIDLAERPGALDLGHEVTVKDGAFVVYHGYIDDLDAVTRQGVRGTVVSCVGAFGKHLSRRGINRRWADTDLRQWYAPTSASGSELATHDSRDRLRITPKAEAWTTEFYRILYDAPTGETIGRTSVSYDLQEGAQNWKLTLAEMPSTTIFQATTSGTGSDTSNTTSTNPPSSVTFQIESGTSQTPTSDGTYYAEISSVIMYASRDHASATLGNVNCYEVALDIIDQLGVDETTISASVHGLDTALTLAVQPFTTNGFENFGSILARIAAFGTSSQESIGFGLTAPSDAPDNLPMLFIETYPTLDDYEYVLTLEEGNVSVRRNLDDVWNWIIVEYTDLQGKSKVVTPSDDANLTDSDSVTRFGQQEKILKVPVSDSADAVNIGRRFLARHKLPRYAVTSPVVLSGIQSKFGNFVPAHRIRAGDRIQIVDLPNLPESVGPGGTVFLVTATNYDHNTRRSRISLGGTPDDLGVLLAQLSAGILTGGLSPATQALL